MEATDWRRKVSFISSGCLYLSEDLANYIIQWTLGISYSSPSDRRPGNLKGSELGYNFYRAWQRQNDTSCKKASGSLVWAQNYIRIQPVVRGAGKGSVFPFPLRTAVETTHGTSLHTPLEHVPLTLCKGSCKFSALWVAMCPATMSVSREDGELTWGGREQLTILVTKGEGHKGSMMPVPKDLAYPNNSPIRALPRSNPGGEKGPEAKLVMQSHPWEC